MEKCIDLLSKKKKKEGKSLQHKTEYHDESRGWQCRVEVRQEAWKTAWVSFLALPLLLDPRKSAETATHFHICWILENLAWQFIERLRTKKCERRRGHQNHPLPALMSRQTQPPVSRRPEVVQALQIFSLFPQQHPDECIPTRCPCLSVGLTLGKGRVWKSRLAWLKGCSALLSPRWGLKEEMVQEKQVPKQRNKEIERWPSPHCQLCPLLN